VTKARKEQLGLGVLLAGAAALVAISFAWSPASAEDVPNYGGGGGGGGASLPSQTGNSGKFLTTDGTDASWGVDGSDLTSLNATQLTSGTIPDARFPAVLPAVSGANLTNLPASGGLNPSTSWEFLEEFAFAPLTSPSGAYGFAKAVGGTGDVSITSSLANEINAWIGSTFSGTTASARIFMPNDSVILGYGETICELGTRTTTLSDGTDTYTLSAGFGDGVGNGTDAVMFRYTHDENSGKWTLVARSNSTETTADSGVTVAANTYYRLRIVVNAAGNSVQYFINGSSVGTITTNIPTGSSRGVTANWSLVKSAGSTNRFAYIFYYYLKFTPTGGR